MINKWVSAHNDLYNDDLEQSSDDEDDDGDDEDDYYI